MSEHHPISQKPNWELLYEIAAAQEGYFTASQAASAGYSPQLIVKYLNNGKFTRIQRAIYRLVYFPAGEHEELTVVWLWSEFAGIFTHETALFLHRLSDALPATVHITLPASWKKRRLKIPPGIVTYYCDIPDEDMRWAGPIPITAPLRTLQECMQAGVPREIIKQALRDLSNRGTVSRSELAAFEKEITSEDARK